MKPSIGHIVHYRSYGTPGGEYPSVCRAAVVTEVGQEYKGGHWLVGLAVLNPEGMFFNRGVSFGTSDEGGAWHWPERVE